MTEFGVFYFDGVGWGPILDRGANSLAEARAAVEHHRFHRPLQGASARIQ